MLWNGVTRDCYDYICLLRQYLVKNTVCIKRGIVHRDVWEKNIVVVAVKKKYNLQWFKLIFDLCNKVDTAPTKHDFEEALNLDEFNKISKECQSIIKKNYQTFYCE